jgi:flavorubredoxin
MVATLEIPPIKVANQPIERRLTMQVAEIAADTTTIRSLDWDRDRFDIEFGLQNGTTYNSYIIRGEKLALVDTSHAKFRELYLQTLNEQIDPSQIEYLVISHTEPDHSGLVPEILALAPNFSMIWCISLLNSKLSKMAIKLIWVMVMFCSL